MGILSLAPMLAYGAYDLYDDKSINASYIKGDNKLFKLLKELSKRFIANPLILRQIVKLIPKAIIKEEFRDTATFWIAVVLCIVYTYVNYQDLNDDKITIENFFINLGVDLSNALMAVYYR